ncbi:hypothetical protein LMG27198_10620 [Methylocystis echinoides]|uniref:Uncharacterized protein n=1 Tax=Methylocystis echinoides TaxID=29468 RepID=A0A9W6GSK6_9HYPH|nr:hypothetical protein LMG27198_10620 [Methylocystis echinoides]
MLVRAPLGKNPSLGARTIPDRLALFVEREEMRLADAVPFAGALGREGFRPIRVVLETEVRKPGRSQA